MYTVSNILEDINRGCAANNMIETCFAYRIVYFVNENGKGEKYYIDTPYSGLRKSLESIIRNHLSLTNSIVVAQTTALKNGKCVCLQTGHMCSIWMGILNRLLEEKRKNI